MTRAEAKKLALSKCKPFLRHAFDRWMAPVIRNMPTHSVIDELVAVQPMQEPSPGMFYLEFVYDSRWERFKRWVKGWLRTMRRRRICAQSARI